MFDLAEIILPKAVPELLFNITHAMFVMFYTNYKTFQVKQMEKFVVGNIFMLKNITNIQLLRFTG